MPALSMFYGIIVRMQSEKGGKHSKPHIHALYREEEIIVSLNGEVLEGKFPNRQLKNSIQEVIDDLSGKEKLPEARNLKELDQLLSSDDALESSK